MKTEKTLVTLMSESNHIANTIIENYGELTPELEASLMNINYEVAHKVDGYKFVMERLELEEKYWKEKAALYQDISRSFLGLKERLKDRLKYVMLENNLTEMIGIEHKFKLSKTKPALLINEEFLPTSYMQEKITYEPNKTKIREDLLAGKKIEGTELKESYALRSYVRKD